MVESICVGILGYGSLFENKSIHEIEVESNKNYWKKDVNKQKRLW